MLGGLALFKAGTMATCASCGLTILFGGKRVDGLRFCSDKCVANSPVLLAAQQVPHDAVARLAATIHRGPCPKCGGPGPVDVHTAHSVWSAIFVTSWRSVPQIVCKSCGAKAQLEALVSSALLGWWGAWGVVATPFQIWRNIAGLLHKPDPHIPSDELSRLARLQLGRELRFE